MLSRVGSSFYRTAAWRLALRSTLVFAAGSAAVFLAMYFIVARTVRERSDSWLTGESETLRQVALNTPRDALYDRMQHGVAIYPLALAVSRPLPSARLGRPARQCQIPRRSARHEHPPGITCLASRQRLARALSRRCARHAPG